MRTLFVMLAAAAIFGCASTERQTSMDTLRIAADGTTYFNGKKMSIAAISKTIVTGPMIIQADSSASHDKVVEVLGQLQQAGVSKVSFHVDGKSEK